VTAGSVFAEALSAFARVSAPDARSDDLEAIQINEPAE